MTSGPRRSSSRKQATASKAAVDADAGVAEATRQAVLDARLAICIAKAKL